MLKRLITVCLIFTSGVTFGQSAPLKYINTYKEAAIQMMNKHGVPASIILGVAMHESGSGTSRIARYLNNHFGMKGSSGPKTIRSAYKGYHSVADSYEDFIAFLKKRAAFSHLFMNYPASNYKNWVKGIQRGGYARSQTWGSEVLAIIKAYRLYELDGSLQESVADDITPSIIVKQDETQEPPASYKVKKGDTLSKIAKRFSTSVEAIRKQNNLKTIVLQPGQELIIEETKQP